MAVMMKQGPAQYEGQGFLVTGDSGKSWKFAGIPNTTLYSFLRASGKYWTVGTEVIHKDGRVEDTVCQSPFTPPTEGVGPFQQ